MDLKIVNKKKDKFTLIDNNLINTPILTPKAKWILIYILSKPYDWEVYQNDITNHANAGKQSIRSGIQELIKRGYITRTKKRNDKGQFVGYEYFAYEKPINSITLSEVRKPDIGKSDPTNTECTKKDKNVNFKAQEDEVVRQEVEKAGYAYTATDHSIMPRKKKVSHG